MAINLLQDIDDQINKLKAQGYATAGGSDAVNAIGNQDTANVIDELSQLRNKNASQLGNYQTQLDAVPGKYQGTIDNLDQQISDNPAKYQPEYDSHAVQEQTDLRRAVENAANYGQLGGGALPQWQLQASATKQNADNSTESSQKNEMVNLQSQLADTNRQKQQDIDSITNTISSLNDQGETDLQSLLSQGAKSYQADVQKQQSAEAAAAEQEAEAEAKLQEQQYEAELAAQARIDAAQIAAEAKSGGSSGGSSSSSSGSWNGTYTPDTSTSGTITIGSSGDDVYNIQNNLSALGYGVSADGDFGPQTEAAIKQFQADYGLKQTGKYDSDTSDEMTALFDQINNPMDTAYAESGREAVGRGRAQ